MEFTTMGWVLLAVGFVPWRVAWQRVRRRRGRSWQRWDVLDGQAVFWQLRIERRSRDLSWHLTLPAIERSKAAIWAALQDLIKG